MEKSLLLNSKIFIGLLLLFVTASCDRECDSSDCPTDQFFIEFEVIDSLGRNCAEFNPDFEAILLSSNDLNQEEVVVVINGDLKLSVHSSLAEYQLKYNQTDSIILDLEGERMTVTCCDNDFEVLLNYELTNRNTNDVVCTNCVVFQLLIPSCE